MKTTNTLKISVVDDDVFSLALYRQHLRNLGYSNVDSFESANACLESLEQEPAIIFLGHQKAAGTELLKKIKQYNPAVYVVVIAGQDDVQNTIQSLMYGAFNYITKGANGRMQIEKVVSRILDVMELLQGRKKVVLRTISPSLTPYYETA
ncbi:MAG: response regulator [Chitinophagaceae bacterium]|nr:response regulator [Chitinophagaceae bacterium]